MKQLIKTINESLGLILSLLLLQKFPEHIRACKAHLYTGFLKRHFLHFGYNSVIAFKAHQLHDLHCISIGNYTQIEKDVQLTAWQKPAVTSSKPLLEIGNNCIIRRGTAISAANHVVIGDNLLTGTNVLITDNAHGIFSEEMLTLPPNERPIVSKGEVNIGNNVWLGNNVCIMPGVTIGNNVVIGANSVVTKSIPANSTAVGIPAKVIKSIITSNQ